MKNKMPRLLFAAPKSGSGKTMITCGMIEVFKRRNLRTVSFKCGPDYIDPMFHRQALGIPSGNLDTFFTDENVTRYLLCDKARNADITVIEGVMGYYDGLGGQSERASAYEVAQVTDTPVVLILDGKGASVSLAAMIKGIIEYRGNSHICGVLLNRVSSSYYERLKEVIERECQTKVLGYLPELKNLAVPSRHLGLIAPEEMEGFRSWISQIADAIEKTVDIEAILSVAENASMFVGEEPSLPQLSRRVRLAVARDEAFSFYYTENLELLKKMGADLVEFSPIHDKTLPEGIDGLLLGGGYPERYAGELEAAEEMRESIRKSCEKGLPCLAECGGFLYLQQELEDTEGNPRKMAGVLHGRGYRTDKLCRFGYIEAESKKPGVAGIAGFRIKGHEFHYWDCSENGEDFLAHKPLSQTNYPCMVHTPALLAGFPHFYYYSNPDMVYQFLLSCQSYQACRLAKAHWDSIAKPIDSLGLLEDLTVKLCKIAGSEEPYPLEKRALLTLCADHGVVEEGVTQTGSEVTKIVSENFAKGCSTVNYMARSAGVDVYTIDMGIDAPPYSRKNLVQGEVIDRKIARGSKNLAKEAAMTVEECKRALFLGSNLVKELKEMGYRILATGEMGIGNTTPTSALAAVFLQQTPEAVTGRGAGLSEEGIQKKCRAVKAAVERIRKKGLTDPVEILAETGGYEIAGMAGVFLGGVKYRIPIVIDGAISSVAALTAMKIDARTADYVIASHQSNEVTGKLALDALGVEAILHGRMCLGEGTGAIALFPLLDMAMEVYRNMGTFEDYRIEAYTRFENAEA